ncbi:MULTISPECIES: hypothetical protein [Pseudoalteromonas]|uniref:Uncharacterized protein n=1 Tax=Pseudoalteromonas piscicida TaxID=43662 RepID=A0A2A5JJ85_PSEO7|nr:MULTISPECIES: hypothetical protein [Pseudoalteromonas]MCF2829778.1 hypothetical protein [Pseudoalteromonas sp. OF5H-5]MCF2834418.1 hypothetical protein [Pseudoalteromonas sp. DL2-H6]MCF2927744.1 hypothetical protein [Pseudoalteromonas sp. DL2-H1]PCK29515.1 hypothetical protein CEX98_22570 [Pseudoalteromonas piscicida]PHI35959.1 hypothetical protein CBQ28_16990 [Pseudoalteromonas sp. GCY]
MLAGYSELLNQLNSWLWLVSISLPFVVLFMGKGSQSYFIVAAVWCTAQLFNLQFEEKLWAIATEPGNLFYWFGSWATIDVLCIALIIFCHKSLKIKIDFEAFSISICLAMLAILQILTYLDGVVWQTYLLGEAYTLGVNTGNLANSLILAVPIVCKAIESFNLKRGTT